MSVSAFWTNYPQRLISSLLQTTIKILACLILVPALCTCGCIFLLWMLIRMPVGLINLALSGGPNNQSKQNQRCILISGGSTVQAVHLARNLSKTGAKVIICEIEGLFGLARFSSACSSYYSLPKPSQKAAAYVRTLVNIVKCEKPSIYIPISATSSAYYDGLAKPHLERLGCECLIPATSDITALDDPLELLRRAHLAGLPSPNHRVIPRLSEASQFYEETTAGILREKYVAIQAGPAGLRERRISDQLQLPATLIEFNRRVDRHRHLNENPNRPWLIIQDPGGTHFVTCTSVKKGRLIANVTCRVDHFLGLIPEKIPGVDRWLQRFLSSGMLSPITGHFSFRLAQLKRKPNELVPISCRVGLGLSYVCFNAKHAQNLLQRPQRHKSEVETNDYEGKSENSVFLDYRHFEKPLQKKEALFAYWDPMPYCIYCYLQLPFRRIAGLLGAQPGRHKPPLAVLQ